MKKLVVSFLLLPLAIMLTAQISTEMLPKRAPVKLKSENNLKNSKSTPVWEVTFDEETPVWTFGSESGTKTWAVSDTTPSYGWFYGGVETSPLWFYMGEYVHNYSESGGNFAWIDEISDYLELFPIQINETYIQFDNIDLTDCLHPKLQMYQNYRAHGENHSFIEYSIDGGTTWVCIEVNAGLPSNTAADNLLVVLLPSEVSGIANVSLRLKWSTTIATQANCGYGWQVDDIQIVEGDPCDLALVDARMNFFEYIDYNISGYETYYHFSSHYGKIPAKLFDSPNAVAYFNIAVTNNGYGEATPVANVKVYDPNMIEIFSNSGLGNQLSYAESDTIDLVDIEFVLGSNPEIGRYTVVYNVSVEGQDDANILDNTDTTYFELTHDEYARYLDEPDGEVGVCMYTVGGIDGERIGSTFYFTHEEEISSVDVFIGESTSVGTEIVVHFLVLDQDTYDWIEIASSPLITLGEPEIGTWINTLFTDPAIVTIHEGYDMTTVLIAIEIFYHGEENKFYIGYDSGLNTSIWGTMWYFMGEEQWVSIAGWNEGGLGIKLNIGDLGLICSENENMSVCVNDDPINLLGLLQNSDFFSGEFVQNNIFNPTIAGVGNHIITYNYVNYFNYECTFNIIVNDLPEQIAFEILPANGVLSTETMGSIDILETDINSTYWTTKGELVFLDEVIGNGETLNLGSEYTAGTYVIWSRNQFGCEKSQGVVSFVENDDIAKIIANISNGSNNLLFSEGDVSVSLYKEHINESDEIEILFESSQLLTTDGSVIFNDIEPGIYYLSSELLNTEAYDLIPHIYYDQVLVFEEASQIIVEEGSIVIANITHPNLGNMEGSNEGSGTVGNQEGGKAVDPAEGKVVVLKNIDNTEILSVCVTDENGYYRFENIPDNTNIQVFVSNFETPNWIPYNTLVGNYENFEVNFIIYQDSVYPDTYLQIGTTLNSNGILELYPNPVSNFLHFVDTPEFYSLKIFDSQGRLMMDIKSTKITEIDVSEFLSGLYFVVLTGNDGFVSVNRFIKQ